MMGGRHGRDLMAKPSHLSFGRMATRPSEEEAEQAARKNGAPEGEQRQAVEDDLYRYIAPNVGPDDERVITDSGIEIKPLYDESDVAPDLSERLGEPASYSFTRGIHEGMYRDRLWTMRQYAGFSSPEDTNGRYRYLLEHGSTGLSMAFDLPTQLGRDSDDPLCEGEVGRTGVPIDTIEDMRICFDQIPLDQISTSGYHIREKGCSAVQEVGFTLANAIAYTQAALDRGLEIDAFAGRLAFFFNCHNNVFQEVAKFRAARRMWAKIMRERFGASKERSQMIRFHTQTGGVTLQAQQPEVNIIRVALQGFAAVAGGTQCLHTNGFDEALALPTERPARVALRTQQVLAH